MPTLTFLASPLVAKPFNGRGVVSEKKVRGHGNQPAAFAQTILRIFETPIFAEIEN
jgi:hypothetical protein